MTTPKELQEQFHRCMPLFMALGDEVRLSIIEVLTKEAFDLFGTGPFCFRTAP